MSHADSSPSAARSPSAGDLQQLWERGQRGRAIRAALDGWEQLLAQAKDLHWLEQALQTCGLRAEAFALQAEIVRRQRPEVRQWEPLIRSVLQSGDPWWARELIEESTGASRELQALRIEAELAIGAASESISAWVQNYRDEAALEAAAGWWMRNGRVDEVERLLDEVDGLTLWRARLELWRTQPEAARKLLASLPASSEVRCLEAIAAVQEGQLEQAESLLKTLLDSEVAWEAGSWLATVLRKQRRYGEAAQAADAAILASPDFNLALRLERELAVEYEHEAAPSTKIGALLARLLQSIGLSRERTPRLGMMRTIGDLEHADALYLLGLKPQDPITTLETVLERFGGNHTPHLTTVEQGTLTAFRLPPDPRHLGATIQLVLWTRGAEAARALYRDLAPRVNGDPLYRIYQGELELWMGAYEEAARIFREALDRDRTVRWAWIGLGASAMLQGDLREAQKIWAKGLSLTGFAGPTLYVYRGECYRRQGESARARQDLEVALSQKPRRLSARINLALLDGEAEALERVHHDCVALAPFLMAELSGSPAEKLEKVLEAMRGNRSSSEWHVCYHLWGRVWRRAT